MKVGLVGCGNIGSFIARYIDSSKKHKLVSVFDLDEKKARILKALLKHKPKISKTVDDVVREVDIVVEAASQDFVREHAVDILRKGRNLMVMSAGALADNKLLKKVREAAEEGRCFVYVPSGAVCGIDGVKSASMDSIYSITLTTTKPPNAFEGVDYLKGRVHLDKIKKPTLIYSGPAYEAVRLFPKNINVSTVLSLACRGFEGMRVNIIANPNVSENLHEVVLKGRCGVVSVNVANKTSRSNPKTSYLACLSAVRLIEDLSERVRVGN